MITEIGVLSKMAGWNRQVLLGIAFLDQGGAEKNFIGYCMLVIVNKKPPKLTFGDLT
jgi:hypothetical protein